MRSRPARPVRGGGRAAGTVGRLFRAYWLAGWHKAPVTALDLVPRDHGEESSILDTDQGTPAPCGRLNVIFLEGLEVVFA